MAISGIEIASPMSLKTAKFLDARQGVENLDELLDLNTDIIPDGFEVYVKNEDCKYKYLSTNDEDVSTGKWRVLISESVDRFKKTHSTFTGDGATTTFDVVHNFNLTDTKAYQITVRDNAKNDIIVAHEPKTGSGENAITLTFDVAPLVTETFDVYLICLE